MLHIFLYKVFQTNKHLFVTVIHPTKISVQVVKKTLVSKQTVRPIAIKPQVVMKSQAVMPAEAGIQEKKLIFQGISRDPPGSVVDDTNILNIIGNLKLPQSVLGQNLFPRKYHALFELPISDNGVNLKLISLNSVSQPMKFLDNIVLQAFLKKLNTINQSDFKKFLMQRDKTADHHVDIMLEFKEEGLNNDNQ